MAVALPKYLTPNEYSKATGLGVEEVKRLCRTGELLCSMTDGGYYKIIVYNDAVPREEYEKVVKEKTEAISKLNILKNIIAS